MKMSAEDVSARLAADFSGSLLFQPLSSDIDYTQPRPVVLLASVAQLLPTDAPLTRAEAVLRNPMFDLLHHDPAIVRRKG